MNPTGRVRTIRNAIHCDFGISFHPNPAELYPPTDASDIPRDSVFPHRQSASLLQLPECDAGTPLCDGSSYSIAEHVHLNTMAKV